ncbi:MAG TPA: MFS transporter [Micromonosporaceae bacterium]|nr:MFS transporter [Micromonosporaceae bacterium]
MKSEQPLPADTSGLAVPPAPSAPMTPPEPGTATVERARIATGVAFFISGLAFASWISRAPAVRDSLDLNSAQFGLLLLCLSTGAVAALPLSGPLVHRIGPARAVLAGAVAVAAGLFALGVGTGIGDVRFSGLGLVVAGLGISTWDVAMNVEGADVERRLSRPLMPRLHAGFSLGTVAGALLAAAAASSGLSVSGQLVATSVLVLAVMIPATRRFLPVPPQPAGEQRHRSGALQAWREPRTLLVGLLVLAFAFTEGTANDWIAVAFVDGYAASDTLAAVGFGVFMAAMTAARLAGSAVLQRWGRVTTLRITAVLASIGLLLVVLGPALPWALAGAALWGAGASLGFPVGMSAAADEPLRAAVRVSVVSSIGYTAFLAGPPLVGFLAEATSIRQALLVVLVATVVGFVVAGVARPTAPVSPPAAPREEGV